MYDFEPITEHILRLELPFRVFGPFSIHVSVWLVRVRDEWVLIDAGPPEAADPLVSSIARATGGAGPRRVLLTHAHYDHAGGLEALRMAWNPALLCHRDEVPFVTGEREYHRLQPHSLAFWLGRFLIKRETWHLPVGREIERGQSADGMPVIHLPGHTPGQVGFLHPQDRAMICGDAVINLGGRLSPPFALSTPEPQVARSSMRRLAELEYEHLLPSHGPPLLDHGKEAMLKFLGDREIEQVSTGW